MDEFKLYVETVLSESSEALPSTAPCGYHGTRCPLEPTCLDDPNVVWIEVGSPSCTAWSPRGTRFGWLDETNIVTIMWAHSLKICGRCPDLIFGEEVPGFDFSWWSKLAGPRWDWHEADCIPADIGIPVMGERKWWTGISSTSRWRFRTDPFAFERHECYLLRRVVGTPEMFLQSLLAKGFDIAVKPVAHS